jgi:glycosyltransferase involved in cell wall biosynthesis
MPVFRERSDRLSRAIDSVLCQRNPHWELIIISDDGVDYANLLCGVVAGDRRFRFASTGEIGAGPSAARNVGLAIAQGHAAAFLDSDDFLEPDKLAVMTPLAMEHGIAVDNTRYGFENGEGAMGAYCPDTTSGFRDLPFFLDIPWPLCPVYNLTRFPGARFAEAVRFAEDMLFNYNLLLCNGGGYFVESSLHNYLIRPVSLSHGPDAGKRAEDAYTQILRILKSEYAPEILVEAMERKRAINRQFLEWQQWKHGSFHEFVSARRGEPTKVEQADALSVAGE